jgi:hypothetical protein
MNARKPVEYKWTKVREAALVQLKDAPRNAVNRKSKQLGITLRCLDEDAAASAIACREKELDAKERFLAQRERDLWNGLLALQQLQELATRPPRTA